MDETTKTQYPRFWSDLREMASELGTGFTEHKVTADGLGMMQWPPLSQTATIHGVPDHGNVCVCRVDCYGWRVTDNALAETLRPPAT